MRARYSVVIVGAGPTGLVLANLLGKAGVATLLVEANAATVGEPRAVSIDDESLRVIEEIGLIDAVRSETVSGYGSEYLGPDRTMFLRVKPLKEPYGHPRRNAFRQPVFEAQLRAGLSRFANVRTLFECRAESFVEQPDAVVLRVRHADGTTEQVECAFLIGCDGASSGIRKDLGFALSGSSLDERWLIIDLENAPSTTPDTIVYCDSKRPGIRLPGPRDTLRYEFKLRASEADEIVLADDYVAGLLRTHDPVPGSYIIRKTVYNFHARIGDRWGRGRVWLGGDAAHLMPPFAGQGMNGGIRDAANLAWKLTAVITGRLGPALLESYERERRSHIQAMIRLALTMGEIFGPRSFLHGWAIRTGFRILARWPAASAYFAEMKYKPPPRFNAGFLLTLPRSRRGIVGRLLPQPRIPDGAANTKLDALLGDGFALLGIDIDRALVDQLSLGQRWNDLLGARLALDSHAVPALADHSGKLLLIRPDRYVMACFNPGDADRVAVDLEALATRSWPGGAVQPVSTVVQPSGPVIETMTI